MKRKENVFPSPSSSRVICQWPLYPLDQELANCGPKAKSGLLAVFQYGLIDRAMPLVYHCLWPQTETTWPIEPRIFIWHFAKKVCWAFSRYLWNLESSQANTSSLVSGPINHHILWILSPKYLWNLCTSPEPPPHPSHHQDYMSAHFDACSFSKTLHQFWSSYLIH